MEGIYCFSGVNVRIRSLHRSVHSRCRDYAAEGEPRYDIIITAEDIEAERARAVQDDLREGAEPRQHPDGNLESMAVYRKLADCLSAENRMLVHGSCIAVDGQAYLFVAKSGVGKSTHTRLWREAFGERAVMVNDDKPILGIDDGTVYAYGTPWDGKHRLSTNTRVPLKAICLLQRAEENSVKQISFSEAYMRLLPAVYRPPRTEQYLRVLETLDKTGSAVSFYELGCNMEPEAAMVSYEGMSGK